MGGATGDPMSVLGTLAGGGQVGRYNGGGKVPPMKKGEELNLLVVRLPPLLEREFVEQVKILK